MSDLTAVAILIIWHFDEEVQSLYSYLIEHNVMVFILTDNFDEFEQIKNRQTKTFTIRSLYDILITLRHIDTKNEPNIIFYTPLELGDKITLPDGVSYNVVTEFRKILLEETSPASQILFLTRFGHIGLPYTLREGGKRFRLTRISNMTDRLVLHISCNNLIKLIEYMSLRTLSLILLRDRLRSFNCSISCSYPITPLIFSWFILTRIKINHNIMVKSLCLSQNN